MCLHDDAIGAAGGYSVTMARPLDPWRTLELPRDATLDDVKAAYRRLAKRYHPDSAGETALARFLAVQAAYEALTEGPARLRLGIGGRTPRPAAARQAPPRQARPTGGPAARPAGGPARGSGAGSRAGSWTDAGAGSRTGASGRAGTRGATGGTGRRGATRKRAKPGSTSYDDAQFEPFEPSWEGASWYGESSGTYWTLNPKEFADPRKHGPEYQARARSARAGRGHAPDAGPGSESGPDQEPWTAREPHDDGTPPQAPPDDWSSTTPGPDAGWTAPGWSPGWTEPGWTEPGWTEPGPAAPGRARPRGASGLGPAPSRGGLASDSGMAPTSAAELVAMGLLGLGIATLSYAILGSPVIAGLEPTVAAGGLASIVVGVILRSLASRRAAG
jgi:curved DNA-binding protein CbpA